jgi:histidinol-phosphate phosphatase family protein
MSMAPSNDVTIVVPTIGRPSLHTLLETIASDDGPLPRAIVLVDDRRNPTTALDDDVPPRLQTVLRVVRGRAAGPAAARNAGWRSASTTWVAFLDDDVIPGANWLTELAADIATAEAASHGDAVVAGTAGRITVPLPSDRRPTDWERNTAGLEKAHWATADLAYRRDVLVEVAGFDERFPRAYREDADLALRVRSAGYVLVRGRRHVVHPVRPAGRWVSLKMQKGNADDALMRRLHGSDWHTRAQVFAGRRPRHLAVTAAGVTALASFALRRRGAGIPATLAWAAGTARFAAERIAPGPRNRREIATMVATSVAIPPLAVGHWLAGVVRWRNAGPWPDRPAAVLLDRDGTLIDDVAYNGDPELVVPREGAREALDALRSRGIRLAVVSNQSGVARGHITESDVAAVNGRVDELLGPFGTFHFCPHAEDDACDCRKPAPGLITSAAQALGVSPRHCVVIGDIGSDIEAAKNAGARGILVPTPQTRPAEIAAAPHVADDLGHAVRLALHPHFMAGRR